MSLTMKDIAKLAGVSHATVSRVINNRPGVHDKTRATILALIDEFGFAPHSSARSLITGRTQQLGLLVLYDVFRKEFPSDFLSDVLAGMTIALSDYGYTVNTLFDHLGEKKNLIRPSDISANRYDGLFLLSLENQPQISYRFAQSELPIVLVNQKSDDNSLHLITVDDEDGAYCATSHLIENGHRKIAFLEGNPQYAPSNERRLGYLRALQEHHLTADPSIMRICYYDKQLAYQAVEEMLAAGAAFSAVFASNDFMALGAYAALKEHGAVIPGDVSVVGFDDSQFAQYIDPPLTTVRKPRMEMGRRAAAMMMNILQNKLSEGMQVTLLSELIERDSVKKLGPSA